MKRFLKLCSFVALVAMFSVSIFGGEAKAVVNGTNATQQYGAVSIWYPDSAGVNRHRCGASLINKYWAVTAAHCQGVLVPGQTQLRTSSLNNANGYEQVGLAQVYIHPDFQSLPDKAELNDIALIRFDRPVTRTLPLAVSTGSPAVGTTGKIAGWGWICDDQVPPAGPPNCGLPYSNVLQEVNIEVAPDSSCGWLSDETTQICTVGANGKHAMACRGDSGTPFVKKVLQRWVLNGVVYGDGDYDVGHPNECDSNPEGGQGTGLVTDVAPYSKWIYETIYTQSKGNKLQLPLIVAS